MPPIGIGWFCAGVCAFTTPKPSPKMSATAQSFIRIVNPSRNPSYTGLMSIVANLAGIAKGMSITFGEILQPTQVENYPDGPGPLRGAVFEKRFRRSQERRGRTG